ncbi:MAG: cupin domain-containing protein [Pseudomonadota bacterium]
MYDLQWLLDPISIDEFASDWWQVRPGLLATDRGDYYGKLFGFENMEFLLEYCQPKPPAIRITSTKEAKNRDIPIMANGRLNMDEIRRHYADGQTIIVNSVEDYSPKVASTIQAIQRELSFRVQANAYLTPATTQGFNPHYDTHDVLVLQIEGEKLWHIYGEDSKCPLNEMIDGDPFRRKDLSPSVVIKLVPGDLLYVPRGWIHEAETIDCASLHLTFGIHAATGRDLVATALENICRDRPEYREALPIGFLQKPVDLELLTEIYQRLVCNLATHGSVEDSVLAIEDNVVRLGRSAGDGQMFSSLNSLESLTLKSVVERRPDLYVRQVDVGDTPGIQFSQSLVASSDEFREGMNFVIQSNQPFRVCDVPGLAEQEQLELVTTLVRDGLLRPV